MQPFPNLGGLEIVVLLGLVLILFSAKKLPGLTKGFWQGILEFRKAIDEFRKAIDDESTEAGRSLGGIYGKITAQALTSDNHVAELYDPPVFENDSKPQKRRNFLLRVLAKFAVRLRRLFRL